MLPPFLDTLHMPDAAERKIFWLQRCIQILMKGRRISSGADHPGAKPNWGESAAASTGRWIRNCGCSSFAIMAGSQIAPAFRAALRRTGLHGSPRLDERIYSHAEWLTGLARMRGRVHVFGARVLATFELLSSELGSVC